MGTSKTTTTVDTGQLSERGESYDSLFNELLMDELGTAGYTMTPVQKTKPGGVDKFGKPLPDVTYTDYQLVRKEDIRITDAISKYGENSPQVAQIRAAVKQEAVDKADALANVESNYLTNLQKYTSGDYSYTQKQYSQIDKFIAPIQNIIIATTQDLLTQFGKDDAMLRESLDGVLTEIDKTGFAVEDALQAASLQYEKSGKNLFTLLKEVNSSSEARAKFQFDLLSEQADLQAAQQAAQFGLPPGSQAEKLAAMKMKTDAMTSIQLDLALQNATGALGIQQGVEAGKQNISLAEVQFQMSQGAKREEVSKMGFSLSQLLSSKIDQAIGARGNALIGTEQQRSGMLFDAAFGSLPGKIQAGGGALQLNQNLNAAKQQQQSALMGQVAQQLGVEQQRTFAETTTEQKKKKSFLDTFTDILGAGASVAGSIYGMSGGGGGGGGGDSGGSGPSTYMPTMNFSTYNQQPFYLDWQNG